MSAESVADHAALLAQDEAARAAALDTTQSFLLQAPAGSGKTTVLTCRLLALLAVADAPEQVLAITFTRKAAAEMRARVLDALRSADAGRPGRGLEAPLAQAVLGRDRDAGWQLLASPARLRIQTIDGFCQGLASQLPIAARLGARLELAVPAAPLYAAAARRVLERALVEAPLREAARCLFARLDNNWSRLEELLQLMLAERAHWLPRVLDAATPDLAQRVGASLRALIGVQLAQAVQRLPAGLRAEGERLAAHAARRLAAAGEAADEAQAAWLAASGPLTDDPADLVRWRGWCGLALTRAGTWRARWNKNQGFPPGDKAEKQALAAWVGALAALDQGLDLCQDLLALPDPAIPAADGAALAALSLLLRQAAAELQLEFAARGQVDYAAVAAAARGALTENGEPTDLALRTGSAIRHVLIDEFQDTSLDQFELLRALTAGWEPGDGRTLFAVGDPMQSIYQFREAEVGLFLRARESGIGNVRLTALRLRRNFRSAPALIDWVNAGCGAIFPRADDARLAAIRYLPALAARVEPPDEPPGGVQVHALGDDDPASEAQRIVQIVRAARTQAPRCTLAVLVAARRQAAPIVQALQAAGFATRGVNLEPLAGRAVVRDLCALARALQHPADRTAWLALLHAPFVGLSLPALHALCADQDDDPWSLSGDEAALRRLDADARGRVSRLRAALAPALQGAERALPLWQRVDRAWLRLGGPAACADGAELADAQTTIEALAAQRDTQRLVGDEALQFASGLYAAPVAAEGAIDVLTMHGAKGLEWDVVIVPGLGRAGRNEPEPLLHWLELPGAAGGSELLLAPVNATGAIRERSVASYIRRVRRQRLQLERARLLYVAATRARQALHWLGHAAQGADGAPPAPRAGTLLALLWDVVGAQFVANGAARDGLVDHGPPAMPPVAAAAALRLPADWQAGPLSPDLRVARLPLSLRVTGAAPEYSWVGLAGRAVGTIVHAELQRLAGAASLPGRFGAAAGDYLGWLTELGVPAPERSAAAGRIVAALAATLRDARGRWLLARDSGVAHSELRLSGLHEGRVVNIIIDRLLQEPAGDCWIVDFKTGSHEGGDLEGFLAQEAERYLPQLRRYAALVHAARDVLAVSGRLRMALYFPLLGVFREITPDGGTGGSGRAGNVGGVGPL